MLISTVTNTDEDGENTIVNDKGYIETYQNTSYNSNKSYRVYFPRVYSGGNGDDGVDQKDDIIDVINWSKLYSISLSCQDKLYTLKATSLT